MRVLLIRPSTKGYAVPPPEVPTGLLYLAAAAHEAGHEVEVRDLDHEELGDVGRFDACGVTVLSKCRQSAFRTIREVRDSKAGMRIVVGGPHVSAMPEATLERLPVDAAVVGEGERAFVEALTNGEKKVYRSDLALLGELPVPAYDLAELDRYYMQVAQSNPDWVIDGMRLGDLRYCAMIASRGCYGRCAFCNAHKHWGGRLRNRDAKDVVDEMEMLAREHGVGLVSFNDNAFPATKRFGMAVCAEIRRRGLRMLWKCDTRPDVVDEELAREMRAAGCFMVAVGLESASKKILENIRKDVDLERCRESLEAVKAADMICYALLMVGNPSESAETIGETVEFLNGVRPHYVSWVRGVMVLPGTEMCRLAGVEDEFWWEGDDLPYYLAERSMDELDAYSATLQTIEKDPVPRGLLN